jgi:hypothetical protein
MAKNKLSIFECDVRGHFKHQSTCSKTKSGDLVWLIPEPDNDYDEFAIRILNSDGKDLGYIPQEDNEEILDLLNLEEHEYCAQITEVEINEAKEYVPWVKVSIGKKIDLPFQQENKFRLHTHLENGNTTYSVRSTSSKNQENNDSKNLMIGILFIVGLIFAAKLISII